MKPIHYRADVAFHQALRCVEYRLPRPDGMRPAGYVLALGLRYGLMGTAASHHLVLSADIAERHELMRSMKSWPQFVDEHVRRIVGPKCAIALAHAAPKLIADASAPAVRDYLPKCRCLHPLDYALKGVVEDFWAAHRTTIVEEWPWFRRRRAVKHFVGTSADSIRFAINFYERRMADIEEVSAIALLDE